MREAPLWPAQSPRYLRVEVRALLHEGADGEPEGVAQREVVLHDLPVVVAGAGVVPLVGREPGHDVDGGRDDDVRQQDVEPDLYRQGVHKAKQLSGDSLGNLGRIKGGRDTSLHLDTLVVLGERRGLKLWHKIRWERCVSAATPEMRRGCKACKLVQMRIVYLVDPLAFFFFSKKLREDTELYHYISL